jgi:1-acyl-sn-glycerol-3-phosphate acyltransferase
VGPSGEDVARVISDVRAGARLALRTLSFIGLTAGVVGAIDVACSAAPAAGEDAVLAAWKRRYGRAMLRLLGARVHMRGAQLEAGGALPGRDARGLGRVFVMNHRSMLDIFVTLALVDASIVSRADLARWPVIGHGARRVGTLFVERGDKASGAAVIDAMVDALRRGRGVMVYPEGGTHGGDDVWAFRAGAFVAAKRAGAEVVPVGIAYAEPAAEFVDEATATHLRRVGASARTHVAVVVGAPLSSHGDGDVDDLEARARAAVQGLVREARASLAPPA